MNKTQKKIKNHIASGQINEKHGSIICFINIIVSSTVNNPRYFLMEVPVKIISVICCSPIQRKVFLSSSKTHDENSKGTFGALVLFLVHLLPHCSVSTFAPSDSSCSQQICETKLFFLPPTWTNLVHNPRMKT